MKGEVTCVAPGTDDFEVPVGSLLSGKLAQKKQKPLRG